MNPFSDLIPKVVHTYTFHEHIEVIYNCFLQLPKFFPMLGNGNWEYEIWTEKQLFEIGCVNKYKRDNELTYLKIFDGFCSPFYKTYSQTSITSKDSLQKEKPITRISWYYDTTKKTTMLKVEIFVTNSGDDLGNDFSWDVFPKERHMELSLLMEKTIKQTNNEAVIINSILINRPIALVFNLFKNWKYILTKLLSRDYEIRFQKGDDDYESWFECININRNANIKYKIIKSWWNPEEASAYLWFEKTRNDKPTMNHTIILTLVELSEVSCYCEITCKQGIYLSDKERKAWSDYNMGNWGKLKNLFEQWALFQE